ncbi:hypothetical protein [Streptomyces sp. NPDC001422]|uniref:hypothetical protein n=1 Tax=Streptomyces sp. NPDC001422 TaxID=3364575 RepID=UPI0036C83DF6
MTTTTEIGQYRPAARLKEGWQLKHDGVWAEITTVVQVTSPLAFAMLTLADGFEVSVPHSHEVLTRTKSGIAKAAPRPCAECPETAPTGRAYCSTRCRNAADRHDMDGDL